MADEGYAADCQLFPDPRIARDINQLTSEKELPQNK